MEGKHVRGPIEGLKAAFPFLSSQKDTDTIGSMKQRIYMPDRPTFL